MKKLILISFTLAFVATVFAAAPDIKIERLTTPMQPDQQAQIAKDLEQILALNKINTPTDYAKLTPQQEQEGFVIRQWKAEELAEITANPTIGAVVVARDVSKQDAIVGYLVACRPEMSIALRKDPEQKKAMKEYIDRLGQLPVPDGQGTKLLNQCNFFIVVQVCVAKDYRFNKVCTKMHQEVQKIFADQCDYVMLMVHHNNKASIAAHQKIGAVKCGMASNSPDALEVYAYAIKSDSKNN